jgi:microcystin-dependent protein
MSDPFIGEIRIFPYSFIPFVQDEGAWFACDGRLLQIQAYAALYAILGTRFGGNGTTNFALPNLSGRIVVGPGLAPSGGAVNRQFATSFGATSTALNSSTMPTHTHPMQRKGSSGNSFTLKTAGPAASSTLGFPCKADATSYWIASTAAADTTLGSQTIGLAGGNAAGGVDAHSNLQPYQTYHFCIAWMGIYPINPG